MKKIIGYIVLVFMLVGCTGEEIYKAVIKSRVNMANLTLKSKNIDGGLTVSYYENNVKSDKTLVMLHGFTDNKETWLLFAQGLLNRYHLIIPDQIGYGVSSKPMNIDYSLDAQSDRLHKFLSTFQQKNFVLVGNSMGGGIALTYASHYPVEKLILVDSMSVKGTHEAFFANYSKSEKERLIYGIRTTKDLKESLHLIMERVPYAPQSVLEYLTRLRRQNNTLIEYQTPFIFDEDLNVRGELADNAVSVDIPTLIVWGNRDRIIDISSAYALHDIMSHSELKVYNRVGHAPMQEVPYRLARDVLKFLR